MGCMTYLVAVLAGGLAGFAYTLIALWATGDSLHGFVRYVRDTIAGTGTVEGECTKYHFAFLFGAATAITFGVIGVICDKL